MEDDDATVPGLPATSRLETAGYATSRLVAPDSGSRDERVCRITGEGLAAVRAWAGTAPSIRPSSSTGRCCGSGSTTLRRRAAADAANAVGDGVPTARPHPGRAVPRRRTRPGRRHARGHRQGREGRESRGGALTWH